MNTKLGLLVCAASISALGLTIGCGDSAATGGAGGTTSSTTGTTSGTTTSSSKSSSATGTGSTTSATGSTGTGASITCDSYCTKVIANCTGANQAFADKAACMTACMGIDQNTSVMTGNTLGCHDYHATVAGTDPTTHCGHAKIPATAICL